MKKLFGLLCIVHWPLINTAMFSLNLHAPWYYSEHALVAELLTGLINLGITLYGFSIFFPKAKLYISIIGALLFTCYQTFAFGWGLDRQMAKLDLSPTSFVLLERVGSGAESAHNIILLNQVRKKYGVFLQETMVEYYQDVISGRLALKDGDVVVTLTLYDKQTTQETIPISELTMH